MASRSGGKDNTRRINVDSSALGRVESNEGCGNDDDGGAVGVMMKIMVDVIISCRRERSQQKVEKIASMSVTVGHGSNCT